MSVRIDLPELGEGQFIEIKEPKFLPWGVSKEITSLLADNRNVASQLEVAERLTVALAKTGYILYEDGTAVVFPLTVESVKTIPSSIVEVVSAKFAELKGQKVDQKN